MLGGLFGAPDDFANPAAKSVGSLGRKGAVHVRRDPCFNLSVIQLLPLERIAFLRPLPKPLTKGWQFLNITYLDHRIAVQRIFGSAADGRR